MNKTIGSPPAPFDVEVAIIGAGMGGITAAHHLRRAGVTDFVMLERAAAVGGTWRDNHYPGLAVDIPSFWYQLPFAPNPRWSRFFSPGPEVHRYLSRVVDNLDLGRHIEFGCEVTQQTWQDGIGVWELRTRSGRSLRARYVISAVGGYVNAKTSIALPGMDEFRGTVLRPNDWDDSYALSGKCVAVVGTGSSGAQIVGALSGEVAALNVFQRTPGWMLPKPDFAVPHAIHRLMRLPGVTRGVIALGGPLVDGPMLVPLFRVLPRCPEVVIRSAISVFDGLCRLFYRALLRARVHDKPTRRALMPRYGIFGKRPIFTNDFLPAFNAASTALITTPIDRVTATGIRTTDGVEYPADLIVMATGYEMWTDPETYRPGMILGRNGIDVAEEYAVNGLRAYNGTSHPELPNRWDLVGPSGYQGFSWPEYVDMTARHATRVIREARARNADVIRVGITAFERWNAHIERRSRALQLYYQSKRTRDVNTYYVNSQGETVFFRPQTVRETKRFVRDSALDDYVFERRDAGWAA